MTKSEFQFIKSNSLSEMIEASEFSPIIIFKYSSTCNNSTVIENNLEKAIKEKRVLCPIYKIVIQNQPILSGNIASHFDIKHESPQIIILNKGRVTHTAHHKNIKTENFVFI